MTLESAYLEARDLAAKRQRPDVSAADVRSTGEWTADLKRRLAGVRHFGDVDPVKLEFLEQMGLLPSALAKRVRSFNPKSVSAGRAG